MEIIKHGNKYKDRKLVCEKCGCKFLYNNDDIFSMSEIKVINEIHFEAIYYFVDCPECSHRIRIGY